MGSSALRPCTGGATVERNNHEPFARTSGQRCQRVTIARHDRRPAACVPAQGRRAVDASRPRSRAAGATLAASPLLRLGRLRVHDRAGRGPLTDSGVRKIVARAGTAAALLFPVHPPMLRHATGYKLANDGQDTQAIQHYLGHRNIVHTTRYTNLAPDRFKMFWRD